MRRWICVMLVVLVAGGIAWMWLAGGTGRARVATVTFSEWRRNALGRIALFTVKNETGEMMSMRRNAVIRYVEWTGAGWERKEVEARSSGPVMLTGIEPGSGGTYRIQLPFAPETEVASFEAGIPLYGPPTRLSKWLEAVFGRKAQLRESVHWSEVVTP